MDPNPTIINISSDSEESNPPVPTQQPTRPLKSPFCFTSDEESEEEKAIPAPPQGQSTTAEEPDWASYFPSMPPEEADAEEEEALEIPPLAIVYPEEYEAPSEVGSSKKPSGKRSKKANQVKPPNTGRAKGKKRVEFF